jgi:choline dehydrogenase-like flavoprotein
MEKATEHDVVVVGSGCTGGAAAWQLSRRGLRVLLLEAGDHVSAEDTKPRSGLGANISRAWRVLVSRRQRTQSLHPGYWMYNPDLFVDDTQHPYSTPEGRSFVWIRGRQVGGRSLLWGGLTLRLSPNELEGWPLRYEDLAPFYDDLERVLGVRGAQDGVPQLPNGNYDTDKTLTSAEAAFKERIASRWPDRRVVIGRGPDQTAENGFSRKTSVGSTLDAAAHTGLVEIRPNSVARRVIVDEQTGRARFVEVADRKTRTINRIPARAVIVCASTLESVRLLLNSQSPAHPNGLGNSSGYLGRCIMNHISRSVTFRMKVDHADDYRPFSPTELIVIPRYENIDGRTSDVCGGFGICGGIQRTFVPRQLLAASPNTAFGFLLGYGECLSYPDNKVELTNTLDEWGVPTLHIDVRYRESDRRMADRIDRDMREMIAAADGEVMDPAGRLDPLTRHLVERVQKAGQNPGAFVHEVGGARMGASCEDSVVNEYCQVWDAPNVFVTDGACWRSSGWQNPTLTMMAITARSCAFVADQFARREL